MVNTSHVGLVYGGHPMSRTSPFTHPFVAAVAARRSGRHGRRYFGAPVGLRGGTGGAVGTIASVDLRRLHPDLMKRLRKCNDPVMHRAANVEALDREARGQDHRRA